MTEREDLVRRMEEMEYELDYSKSREENWQIFRQKYFELYGEYPPEPKKMEGIPRPRDGQPRRRRRRPTM